MFVSGARKLSREKKRVALCGQLSSVSIKSLIINEIDLLRLFLNERLILNTIRNAKFRDKDSKLVISSKVNQSTRNVIVRMMTERTTTLVYRVVQPERSKKMES